MSSILHIALAGLAFLMAATPAQALDLALLRTKDGTVPNAQFGFSCVVVGDMDGDGFADFAIGASGDSTPGVAAGRVLIYRGGPEHLDAPPAAEILGTTGDLLGYALAPAGDLDGDGLADLVIGAPGSTDVVAMITGRVMIVFGANPIGSRTPISIAGTEIGGRFGSSVANLGDVNGDGIKDFGVGAPGANSDAGRAVVYRGGPLPTTLFSVHGREFGDEFGTAISGARVRGAAVSDVLVGAPYASDFLWEGKVYLYFGGATADTLPDRIWTGFSSGDLIGSAVAGIGDVNGDGREDVLVGAPGANVGPLIDAGRAYLYLGAPAPPLMPALSVAGSRNYHELGQWLAGIGDVNGDGRKDFAIGAPGTPDAFTAGEVRVFLGRAVPGSEPDTTFYGEDVDDMFGRAISNGGRLLPGPTESFLVGSYPHANVGRAYLFGRTSDVVEVPNQVEPRHFDLAEPWPNPSRGSVRFSLDLEHPSRITLAVFDVGGRRASTIYDGAAPAGRLELAWDSSRSRPGLYWAVFARGADRRVRPIVVLGR